MNILKLKNRYLASTVLQYSLFTTLVMIAFWLVLRLLGGGDQPWFYIVNFFILILGIFQVDKTLIQRGNPNHITLVISGILYGNITALLFAFYTILYLGLIDTTLLHQLQNNTNFGAFLTPFTAGIVTYTTISFAATFIGYVCALFFFEECADV